MIEQNGVFYVTVDELIEILMEVAHAQAIGIIAETKPSCFYKREGGSRKKDARPCPPVVKLSHVSGMTCFGYERSRNNDNAREHSRQIEALRAEGREAEASELEDQGPKVHELKPRTWGVRLQGTPFIEHTPKGSDEAYKYLEMMISNGSAWASGYIGRRYVNPETGEEYSLKEGEPNSLHPWLKPYTRRDDDPNDYDYREFRMDHVVEVHHEQQTFVIGDPPAEAEAEAA